MERTENVESDRGERVDKMKKRKEGEDRECRRETEGRGERMKKRE